VKIETPAATKIETEEQKTLYSLGFAVSDNLKPFGLTAAEIEIVKTGFADGVAQNKPTVEPQAYYGKIRELQTTRMAALATREKEAGLAYLEKTAAEQGAIKLPSGVVIATIKEGTGASPAASDTVKVHYHGTLTNGKVFDSSVERNEPATFPLSGVIPCWTEGVQKIKVGGKSKLVCPSEQAYGERGAPPDIGPGATLVFEVELLEIVKGK
jgi:FKBP-type peptidyl-prolyl cis-trans isomerase FkpA/FKBP-type peptidyl-prolyl cis-trans isomerase FklB